MIMDKNACSKYFLTENEVLLGLKTLIFAAVYAVCDRPYSGLAVTLLLWSL